MLNDGGSALVGSVAQLKFRFSNVIVVVVVVVSLSIHILHLRVNVHCVFFALTSTRSTKYLDFVSKSY